MKILILIEAMVFLPLLWACLTSGVRRASDDTPIRL